MTCDQCGAPSCGPRCPLCVRNHGDAPLDNPEFRVELPTQSQSRDDYAAGWEPGDES